MVRHVIRPGAAGEDGCRRILVLGREKTGTTAISSCIAKTIGTDNYLFEPRKLWPLDLMRGKSGVAKLLFEQWQGRTHRLRGLITGRIGPGFDSVIIIVRDPRAALVSSVLYGAYDFFLDPANAGKKDAWLEVIRRKQDDPAGFGMEQVLIGLAALSGVDYHGVPPINGAQIADWLAFIDSLPAETHVILRYEDFIARDLRGHPCAALLGKDRTVSPGLQRTHRTGGAEDWQAYFLPQEINYLNQCWQGFMTRYGYPFTVAPGHRIAHAHCLGYVERLIDEACRNSVPARSIPDADHSA